MDELPTYMSVKDRETLFYPVKAVSRAAARKRLRKAVFTTTALAVGVGISWSLSSLLPGHATIAATPPAVSAEAPAPAPVQQAEIPDTLKNPVVMPTLGKPLPNANMLAQLMPSAGPAANAIPPASEAAQPLTPPSPSPKTYPLALDLQVKRGDTLLSLLTDAGASEDDARMAVASLRSIYNAKNLDIGKRIAVRLDKGASEDEPVISKLTMPISPTTSVEMKRKSSKGGFVVKKVDAPLEKRLARAGGKIRSSLYQTGISSGIPRGMLEQIVKAYSYDVDFQRDIHPGDSIDVMFEKIQTKDGYPVKIGNMVYAELRLDDRVLKLYRYVDKQGNADYYNEKGESVRKALLRTPINGAHITSGFGMRMHPLLGYSKMHRGVDFGAATGTPVYAAGDGVIDYEGGKGGYGNYLRINHSRGYATAYGHLSRFASGLRIGSKVRQGQIVAYVGSTGMSTGPHLHYEILVNNEQVNPANVKFKGGFPLLGKDLVAFKTIRGTLEKKLASLQRGKTEEVAQNTVTDTPAKASKKSAKN